MKKILVIGSANVDITIHSPRMPALGETLVGGQFSTGAGGKGLNQAIAIKKLGGDVSFFCEVGDDKNGLFLLSCLERYGVDFRGEINKDVPTGCALITVVGADNFIVISPGANALINTDTAEKMSALIAEADMVVMQYEIDADAILHAAKIAKDNGTTVVVNPAPYKKLPDSFYPLVDLLVPNEHEAFDLTGIHPSDAESAGRALAKLKALGVGNAVITLGERGCIYTAGDEPKTCPAVKTKAVDTTSAGDSFIGAMCVRLCAGDDMDTAVKYATKVSALTVSRSGASDSIPYAEEIT